MHLCKKGGEGRKHTKILTGLGVEGWDQWSCLHFLDQPQAAFVTLLIIQNKLYIKTYMVHGVHTLPSGLRSPDKEALQFEQAAAVLLHTPSELTEQMLADAVR